MKQDDFQARATRSSGRADPDRSVGANREVIMYLRADYAGLAECATLRHSGDPATGTGALVPLDNSNRILILGVHRVPRFVSPQGNSSTKLLMLLALCGKVAVFQAASAADATPPASVIDEADLKRHAGFLASDSLEGRQAGARGGQAAAAYLITELKRIGVQPAGTGGDFRQPFGSNYANILGRIPGNDANLHRELIVVGAHYDHVGYGNPANSYGPYGRIHNGADDNGSGVSVLLEVAEFLQNSGPRPRTVLLAFWDAEEAGMLGSLHWVDHPTVDRQSIRLAVNLDMIGRLRNEQVNVMGWRTAAGLRTWIAQGNDDAGLQFKFGWSVTADSDHHSFYARRIPVLHFDTDKHDDYHRPSDDVERLNWNGMQRIGSMLAKLIDSASRVPSLPAFRLECWNERQPAAPKLALQVPPIRLGITWRPELIKQNVLEVLQTTDGYPAAALGLKPGDRLLRFGAWQSGSLAELRSVVAVAPSEVTVSWISPGTEEPHQGVMQLRGEPLRIGLTYRQDSAVPGCGVVESVVETSPADQARILPGDVLLSCNGERLPPPAEFSAWVTHLPAKISIQGERNGRPYLTILTQAVENAVRVE